MPSRKAEIFPADESEIVYEVGGQQPEEMTESEQKTQQFADILSEKGEAGKIVVHREDDGPNSKSVACGQYRADKYDFFDLQDHIQRTYGGGDYRFRLYEHGRIVASKVVSLAHPINGGTAEQANGFENKMLEMIEGQNRRMEEFMRSSQGGGTPKTTMELLQEMQIMREVFDPRQAPTNPMQEMLTTLTAFKELGFINTDGGGGDTPGFEKLLSMGADLVSKAADKSQQEPARLPNPQPRPRLRRPAPPTPQQMAALKSEQRRLRNPKISIEEQEKMKMLKLGLQMLLQYARTNASHDDALDLIWAQVPESQIKDFLCQPDSLQTLASISTEVLEHKQWFEDLAEHAKASLGMPSKFADQYEPAEEMEETGEFSTADFPTEEPMGSNEVREIVGDDLTCNDGEPMIEGDKPITGETLDNGDVQSTHDTERTSGHESDPQSNEGHS